MLFKNLPNNVTYKIELYADDVLLHSPLSITKKLPEFTERSRKTGAYILYIAKLSKEKTFMVRQHNGYSWETFMVACLYTRIANQQGHI